jgi:hypothetical protein
LLVLFQHGRKYAIVSHERLVHAHLRERAPVGGGKLEPIRESRICSRAHRGKDIGDCTAELGSGRSEPIGSVGRGHVPAAETRIVAERAAGVVELALRGGARVDEEHSAVSLVVETRFAVRIEQ